MSAATAFLVALPVSKMDAMDSDLGFVMVTPHTSLSGRLGSAARLPATDRARGAEAGSNPSQRVAYPHHSRPQSVAVNRKHKGGRDGGYVA